MANLNASHLFLYAVCQPFHIESFFGGSPRGHVTPEAVLINLAVAVSFDLKKQNFACWSQPSAIPILSQLLEGQVQLINSSSKDREHCIEENAPLLLVQLEF